MDFWRCSITRLGHLAIRLLILLACILFVLAIFVTHTFGQKNLIPPELPVVTDFHCSVEPTAEGWQATATATYLNPTRHHDGKPWQILIADFKNKNRKKARTQAEKSCNDWLDAVDKVRAEIMPVDAKKETKK